MFGPMDDFRNLRDFDARLDAGLKPSYMRFLIALVGSSQTNEVPAIDRLEIPYEIFVAPPPPPPIPKRNLLETQRKTVGAW